MKHPAKLRSYIYEALPVFGIIALFFMQLRYIMRSTWQGFFFNNADFLTLPLLEQSLAFKERFQWVFSSQIFLFPESIFYTFSALVTPNFRLALMLNALINCLLLYVLYRVIVGVFSANRQFSRLYALLSASLILVFSLLELRNGPTIATFYLTTTAYYGIILSAFLAIALSLKLLALRTNWRRSRAFWVYAIILASIALLTTTSNPMYLLQFVIPLMAVVGLGFLINIFSLRQSIIILAPQLVGSLCGMVARKLFFESYFSPLGQVEGYLRFKSIPAAMEGFVGMFKQMSTGAWQQKLELFLLVTGMAIAFTLFLLLVHYATKPRQPKRLKGLLGADAFLVIGMGGLAPLLIFAGVILTGNAATRYLVPLIIFPPLALAPLGRLPLWQNLHITKILRWTVIGLPLLLLVGALCFAHPLSTVQAVSNYYPSDMQCLDNQLKNHSVSDAGVAQYWRARNLQLNSRQNAKVMQVGGLLTQFTWLYNRAAYYTYKPEFVIVDKLPPSSPSTEVAYDAAFTIAGNNVITLLGKPSSIAQCSDFDIYLYTNGNPGQKVLEDRLHKPELGL